MSPTVRECTLHGLLHSKYSNTEDSQETRGHGGAKKISRSGKEARDCGHVGPRLTGGARLSQLRALDLQADEKGPSLIKLK